MAKNKSNQESGIILIMPDFSEFLLPTLQHLIIL